MDLTMRTGAGESRTVFPLASARGAWLVVGLLTALGAYLRLANLGALGFRWDEDLTALAVRAILEHGVPELPSGMVYLRGGWLLYLMAGSAEALGFSELSLRLPAALFGIATIPLAFVFARALFGTSVGLATAALLTISVWDIEIARYARMYAPFAFFYLLTVLLVWRYRVERESAAGGVAAVAAALVAISLHQLGYTLALVFLIPPLVSGRPIGAEPRRLLWPFGAATITAAFFVFWNGFLGHFRAIPLLAADGAAAVQGSAESTGSEIAVRAFGSLAEALASAAPELPLAAELVQRSPAALIGFVALAALALGWHFVRRRTSASVGFGPLADRALLVAVAIAALLQLFNVALIAAVVLAYGKRRGLGAYRSADVRLAAAIIVVGFLVWLTAALALDLTSGPREAVKSLLDYPRFFSFWAFPNEWPLASLLAAVGGLWAFDRAARRPPDSASLFLLLTLITPLVLNGLFDTQYELFRYSVPLDTFYFTLVGLGILRWSGVLGAVQGVSRPSAAPRLGAARLAAGTVFAAALVLAVDLNPLRSFMISERDYSSEAGGWAELSRYRDFKSPAEYVLRTAAPDDIFIVFDTREYYNYLGRLDYWVATDRYETQVYLDGGVLRDLYVGTPLLDSLGALERVLVGPGTKWVIATDSMIAESPTVDDNIRRFLATQEGRVVYVGEDGGTRVYRFDGSDQSPLTVSDVAAAD